MKQTESDLKELNVDKEGWIVPRDNKELLR